MLSRNQEKLYGIYLEIRVKNGITEQNKVQSGFEDNV